MPPIDLPAARELAARQGARLGVWRIDEDEQQLLAQLPFRPEWEQRLRQMGSPRRRREWLAVRALFYAMGAPATARIAYAPSGRPIPEGAPWPHVSISHTAGHALLLVGSSPMGLDAEAAAQRAAALRPRYLSPAELALSPPPAWGDERWAAALWSAKEAAYKYLPVPTGAPLTAVSLAPGPAADQLLASAAGAEAYVSLASLPAFVLAIASRCQ